MELVIYDRNYTRWEFVPRMDSAMTAAETAVETAAETAVQSYTLPLPLPLEQKLFHGDQIDAQGHLISSPYRAKTDIPGVLIVDGKTYGRLNEGVDRGKSKPGKLLYKCVPNDPALPCFLVPYDAKVNTFHKQKTNKYITFKIKDWSEKHPIGQLTHTFGDVSEPEQYYQYQLCCKDLQHPISTFTKALMTKLKTVAREKIAEELSAVHHLADRRAESLFSIDPAGCKDIDDALGLKILDDHHSIISIYIANIALLLDYLQLWSVVSQRVATIYLPQGNIPMLPPAIADDLGSLLQGQARGAFSLDIYLQHQADAVVVTQLTFQPVLIKVQHNYVYEEAALLRNPAYGRLFALTQKLAQQYTYVEQVTDSHHLVEFYMIFMNYESSKRLLQAQTGIFRAAQLGDRTDALPATLTKEMRAFLKSFTVTHCNYCTVEEVRPHDLIGEGLASYVHITSPIRRLVDLINLIALQREKMSPDAKLFSAEWLKRIAFINTTMKTIRKVQNNCTLLHMFMNVNTDKVKDTLYTGLLFNKTQTKNPTVYKFSVYIPVLKMLSTIKTDRALDNYQTVGVSTHSFRDEDNIMKKIRLQLV